MYKISDYEQAMADIVAGLKPGQAIDTNKTRESLERGLLPGDQVKVASMDGIVRYSGETLDLLRDDKVVKSIPATNDALRKILMIKALHDGMMPVITGRA